MPAYEAPGRPFPTPWFKPWVFKFVGRKYLAISIELTGHPFRHRMLDLGSATTKIGRAAAKGTRSLHRTTAIAFNSGESRHTSSVGHDGDEHGHDRSAAVLDGGDLG